MNLKINEMTFNARQSILPSLNNHQKIHKFSLTLYNIYCKLTGNFHLLPNFYILGAAKSGTSSLYEYLIQNPFIHSALTKEPRFFDKYYYKGLDWYKVQFPTKIQKLINKNFLNKNFITGESTVRYFDHPHVPQRIKKITPKAKFIILLRNPIDRAYSHYLMMKNKRKENLSFQEAIDQEFHRTKEEFLKMENDENFYSSEYYHHAYLDRGIYIKKLQRWMKTFPKNQFLIIQSEDFFKNPDSIYKYVLKFLDLPEWHLNEYEIIGPGKYKKSKMNSNTRKKLIEFFNPYNEQLYKFLGKRFDWD
ncbi:MAG: sulfotransferase [Nitrosopumilaceae archaeon]